MKHTSASTSPSLDEPGSSVRGTGFVIVRGSDGIEALLGSTIDDGAAAGRL